MLEQTDFGGITSIERISENIVEKLIVDRDIPELEATDWFYSSNVYTKLADKTTKFYEKSWQEIYEMLEKELKM
jgi:hypothetical protein